MRNLQVCLAPGKENWLSDVRGKDSSESNEISKPRCPKSSDFQDPFQRLWSRKGLKFPIIGVVIGTARLYSIACDLSLHIE